MKKKLLTMVLTITVLFSSFTNFIFAAETSGTCGDGVTWQLVNEGTKLTFNYSGTGTGTGLMNNEDSVEEYPWYDYASDIEAIEICAGVKSIGNYAFKNFSKLIDVNIANGVTSIGEEAFGNCDKLQTINLPDSVTDISSAFENCDALSKITIPVGVTSFEDTAFYRCVSLESVTLKSKTIPTIGTNTFGNCSKLSKIYVPIKSVNAYKEATGWSAFADKIEAGQLTVSDIIPNSFPTAKESGWSNSEGNGTVSYINGSNIVFETTSYQQILGGYTLLTKIDDNKYHCNEKFSYDFYVDKDLNAYKIVVSGFDTISGVSGTYEGPRKVSDILATVENFPICVDVLPLNTWVNDNGINLMLISNTLGLITNEGHDKVLVNDITTTVLTKSSNNYTYTNDGVTITFTMINEKLISVSVSGLTGGYVNFNGIYTSDIQIRSILPSDFPETESKAWVDQNGTRMYVNNSILSSNIPVSIYSVVTPEDDNYSYTSTGSKIVFVMKSGVLQRVDIQGLFTTFSFSPYKLINKYISKPNGYSGDIEFVTNGKYVNQSTTPVTVSVDDIPLTYSTHYEVSTGSTHVILKGSYVKTLDVGIHTIKIGMTGYEDITSEFEITVAPTPTYRVPNTGV